MATQDWDTGRPADVGSLLQDVRNSEDRADVIEAMHSDMLANPDAWENHNLERFLEALAALTGSLDEVMANRNVAVPDVPS